MIDANGLVSADAPDMSTIRENEMGDMETGGGWVDVYTAEDMYIGHVWAQNVPTTRWFAVDRHDQRIGEDYQTRSEAVQAVAIDHQFFVV